MRKILYSKNGKSHQTKKFDSRKEFLYRFRKHSSHGKNAVFIQSHFNSIWVLHKSLKISGLNENFSKSSKSCMIAGEKSRNKEDTENNASKILKKAHLRTSRIDENALFLINIKCSLVS